MGIEHVKNQDKYFVCIKVEEDELIFHERSMLIYNQIPGLLPVSIRYVDEMLHVEYRLLGQQSLSGYFLHRRFDEEQIIRLIHSLYEAGQSLVEYMLSPDGLILDPDYIFYEEETEDLRFCYQPGKREGVEKNVQPLLRFILDHVNFHDQNAVTLAYGLYHQDNPGGDILGSLNAYAKNRSEKATFKDKHIEPEEGEKEDINEGESKKRGVFLWQQGVLGRLLSWKSRRYC